MPVLRVRDVEIPYEVHRSRRARRMRIVVKPDLVRVVAPAFTMGTSIRAFVDSKREWILAKAIALREREVLTAPERFVSGARVHFRGKRYALSIGRGEHRSVSFRNGFLVTVEPELDPIERERVVRALVMDWLEARALYDATAWCKTYGARLEVAPTKIRIGNQKTLWGSCSARGVLSFNWRLVAAPKPVFEYVVVHELCHLIERSHGPRFWRLVGEHMPDYRERRAWLKTRGVGLA